METQSKYVILAISQIITWNYVQTYTDSCSSVVINILANMT